MQKCILFIMVMILINVSYADARPVSYPEGWTVMTMNNGDRNSLHAHYSPTAKYSVGYKFEHWRDGDYNIHAAQLNNLLKRWNTKNSQANFYLKSGLGVATKNDDQDLAAFTGIALDWEDRRFFTSYENRYTEARDIDDFFMQSARVGIAPYIGDYGDLHTWLMVEIEHAPESNDNITVTPLVRFFKGTHLVEAGYSNHDDVTFNWVARF